MKIRHRLSLIFSMTMAGILIILLSIIYIISKEYHEKEFNKRLEMRLELTETFYMESSGLPLVLAQQIRERYLQKLPEEHEWTIEQGTSLPAEIKPYLIEKVTHLLPGEKILFNQGKRQGIARIYSDIGNDYLIIVTALDKFGISKLANLQRILLFAFPLSLAIAGLIGWFTTKKALLPLEVNIAQAKQISATNLDARLVLPSKKDEIYDFVTIFNELLQRMEKAFTFQQTFINHASHEIRNPLTVITGEAEIALSGSRTAESYKESLEIIAQESDRLNELVNNLLSLASTGGEGLLPNRELIPISQLLSEVRKVIEMKWPDQHIVWPHLSPSQLKSTISCNFLMLQSALVNILDNACKYGFGNTIHFTIDFKDGHVMFIIRDSGIGIPNHELPMVFVPLFRASNARSYAGQGIGLPLVERIIRMHGGKLHIQSEIEKGTEVTVIV